MRAIQVLLVWASFSFMLTAIITIPIGFRLLNPDNPYSSLLFGAGFSLLLADIFHRICDYYADALCRFIRI
ncbi:hypothetical protein pEaSNUABM11_00019 [Erwinia phage pEa_SNUABM_11]|nr:hypothetical protein pEaSNUABM11_00019 [Erwinia phage pEa_SNUABM_11]